MIKKIIGFVFLVLIIVNIALFVSSIKLGNEISVYEQSTEKIHEQNLELQKEVARFDSFQYAASAAAALNFVQQSTPVYVGNMEFAKK